jgi:Family of unknown function (DUF6459)
MTAAAPLPVEPSFPPIRIRPAPRREPLFDDEIEGRPRLRLVDSEMQPRLPFADLIPVPERRPVARAPRRRPTPPAAGRFGHTLVQGIVEVLNGLRPATQLNGHLSPAIQAALQRGATELARFRGAGRAPTVRSVHVSAPADGTAEISAVVDVGGRCRAIAARIELRHGRWRCVALQLG